MMPAGLAGPMVQDPRPEFQRLRPHARLVARAGRGFGIDTTECGIHRPVPYGDNNI